MVQDARTHQWAQLLDVSQRWFDDYPDLTRAARNEGRYLLDLFGLSDLDPDEIHWHRFTEAVSNPRAYSGWAHEGPPAQSCSFTELIIQRFPAADQDSLDVLDQLSGFYTVAQSPRFDEHCEVRLLPSQLSAVFWKRDFATRYRTRLADFWRVRTDDYITLNRAMALARLGHARAQGELDANGLRQLRGALAPGTGQVFGPTTLARRQKPDNGLRISMLAIDKAVSRNVLCIETPSAGLFLYNLSHSPVVRHFTSHAALHLWLMEQGRRGSAMMKLEEYFNFNDGPTTSALTRLSQGQLGLASVSGVPLPPGLDPFEWLAERAHAEMQHNADHALTSDSRLRKAQAVAFLSTLSRLTADFAPIGWPMALASVAAAMTGMGLYIDQAVEARSSSERNQAILGAVGQGLLALFTLPFLATAEPADWPWETDEDASPPPTPALPRSPVSREPLNARGMIERTDLDMLFAVQEAGRAQPVTTFLENGLPPTGEFARLPPMLDGAALRTFGSAEGALAFAKANFDGPFHLFRIQARGLRVASLRLNLRLNRANTLAHLGQQDRALTPAELEGLADGAWLENECHLAHTQMNPARLRLLSPLEPRPWHLPSARVLRGVRRQPLSSVLAPSYLIEVEDSLRLVRFDPFSESWRTVLGSAFRYNDRIGRFEPFDISRAASPGSSEIEAATAELGIPAHYPWIIPETAEAERLPIPREIHSVWLGRRMPRQLADNVLRNAREAGKGKRPFTYHLYLDVPDPLDRSLMLADLAEAPDNLRIHELRQTPFFNDFSHTPYHAQFEAATQATGINYASAVDVLRYRLLQLHGGIYMDVDDYIYGSTLENEGFSSYDWTVTPGRLLLNNLVSEPRLGLHCGFNTSNFATLADNPLLENVSRESYNRFLSNRDLYYQRPYEGVDDAESVTTYARRISQVTGPGVFNDVLLDRLPDVRQFRALCRIANELYVPAREAGALYREIRRHTHRYCPLGWRIRIGATSSWLHTR